MRCAVYRYYGDGDLLYIGKSRWPLDRLKQHRSRHDTAKVTLITYDWFDTSSEASRAEVAAIKFERPLWNIRHNNSHVPPSRSRQPDPAQKAGAV